MPAGTIVRVHDQAGQLFEFTIRGKKGSKDRPLTLWHTDIDGRTLCIAETKIIDPKLITGNKISCGENLGSEEIKKLELIKPCKPQHRTKNPTLAKSHKRFLADLSAATACNLNQVRPNAKWLEVSGRVVLNRCKIGDVIKIQTESLSCYSIEITGREKGRTIAVLSRAGSIYTKPQGIVILEKEITHNRPFQAIVNGQQFTTSRIAKIVRKNRQL